MKRAKTKNCKIAVQTSTCLTFVKQALLHAHSDSVIDDEEFVLLFGLNTSMNPDIEHWKYHTSDLNSFW